MTSRNEVTAEQEASVQRLAAPGGALSTADMAAAGNQPEPEAQPPSPEAQPPSPEAQRPSPEAQPQPAPAEPPRREPVPSGQAEATDERTALLDGDTTDDFRGRWQETQADFVDDPRSAVAAADALVAEVMQRLASEFARERDGLEQQWSSGGEASTEDLRLAFQRYRSFFSRLLSL